MFTLKQIDQVHKRLGNSETLPQYLKALNSIGVNSYESYIADGHSRYFGTNGYEITSGPVHKVFVIADDCNQERFIQSLKLSSLGKISYEEMSSRLAESGIEKWTFDTTRMTIAYSDKAGNDILTEDIK